MTERITQQHRRPPDVEEALSSMLWTPYECTPSDSSTEDDDDDERLNRQLCKSQSNYEQQSIMSNYPAPFASSYLPLTTATTTLSAASQPALTSTSTPIPIPLPLPLPLPLPIAISDERNIAALQSTTTPFVPFPSFSLSTNNIGSPNSWCSNQANTATAATITQYRKTYEPTEHSYRFSYPHYGPIPSLTKWWSSTTTAIKDPPSYESLYSKSLAHTATSSLQPVFTNLNVTDTVTTLENSSRRAARRSSEEIECDRSSFRSQIDNVPNERLVHSFTDDYISQVSNV